MGGNKGRKQEREGRKMGPAIFQYSNLSGLEKILGIGIYLERFLGHSYV